jgi:hypothetical protein
MKFGLRILLTSNLTGVNNHLARNGDLNVRIVQHSGHKYLECQTEFPLLKDALGAVKEVKTAFDHFPIVDKEIVLFRGDEPVSLLQYAMELEPLRERVAELEGEIEQKKAMAT